jgi:hypothetical protein
MFSVVALLMPIYDVVALTLEHWGQQGIRTTLKVQQKWISLEECNEKGLSQTVSGIEPVSVGIITVRNMWVK